MPDIGQMARPCTRRDQDDVNPDIVSWSCVAMGDGVHGGRHPAKPVFVNRQIKGCSGCAGLHLDERGGPTAPRDQVNFTDPQLDALIEYPPPVKAQPPCRPLFAPMAKALSRLPCHLPSSAIALA